MSAIQYHLTNRQSKALLVRHTELLIALPLAIDEEREPLAIARASLPDLAAEWIVAAEECDLAVDPTDRGPSGVARALGKILADEEVGTRWHILVAAVVVTLRPPGQVRHVETSIQWPGNVRLGHWRLSDTDGSGAVIV